jgi:hypothetical protein
MAPDDIVQIHWTPRISSLYSVNNSQWKESVEWMNESDVWIGVGVTQFLSYPQVTMCILHQHITRYFHNPCSNITDHMHATANPKLVNLQFRGTHHSNRNIYTHIFSNDLEIYRFKSKYTVHYLLISKFNVWHFHLMHTNII